VNDSSGESVEKLLKLTVENSPVGAGTAGTEFGLLTAILLAVNLLTFLLFLLVRQRRVRTPRAKRPPAPRPMESRIPDWTEWGSEGAEYTQPASPDGSPGDLESVNG
jgi:hypothetical protein